MKNKIKSASKKIPVFTIAMTIIATALVIVVLYRVSSVMSLNDIILIFIYPFLLSYILGYQTTESMERYLDKKIAELIDHDADEMIHSYPTKYTMPDSNAWWNKLFLDAQSRFYIIGVTNKGWIQKDHQQSIALAESIIRIIENDGTVKILSENSTMAIEMMEAFWNQYLMSQVNKLSNSKKRGIIEKLKKNFGYWVCSKTNYETVISDGKMILLTLPNSVEFRSEALVLEIFEEKQPHLFNNYVADFDRTTRGSNQIDLKLN